MDQMGESIIWIELFADVHGYQGQEVRTENDQFLGWTEFTDNSYVFKHMPQARWGSNRGRGR